VQVKASMESKVVNPDESLAELYHQRGKLISDVYNYNRKEDIRKLDAIKIKISSVENAMQTPGKQVRLF
jgi:hypothetical protein